MCDKNGISGGEGGSVLRVNFWKIQRGGGVIGKIPSVGGGMDIFWNYTIDVWIPGVTQGLDNDLISFRVSLRRGACSLIRFEIQT